MCCTVPIKVRPQIRSKYFMEVVWFPDSRVRLCAIAREYASVPATDSSVPEAQTYSFKYNGEEVPDIALLCPKLPEMYLRLKNSLKRTITLTFVQNPYEHYVYKVQFFSLILASSKCLKVGWFFDIICIDSMPELSIMKHYDFIIHVHHPFGVFRP